MKLVHSDFPCQIEFIENRIQTLVIENPQMLTKYLSELLNQEKGGEGKWILSEKGELCNLQKECQAIMDPFSLDFNQRKMINALYEEIERVTLSTELILEWNKLYPFMMEILDKMIQEFDYDLCYSNEIEIKDFLKVFNLRFADMDEKLPERLIDYMCLTREVLGTALFVLVNIKAYLDEEELGYLFQQAFYKKIHILLLESHISEQRFKDEIVTIIDPDCCVIR